MAVLRRLNKLVFLVIIQNLFFFTNCSSNSRIQISADGGYSNIVIKFDNDVSQHHCSLYIKYLTEMITEASGVLSRAGAGLGGGGVYFKQVTIVIPHHWDESHCRVKLVAPGRGVAYQTADIRVRSEPVISPQSPYTQHSQQCGHQGEQIIFPENFFINWNSTMDKFVSPAKLFVKEWAKFRYGIFDEHGFAGDILYPNFYKVQGKYLPTGTSNIPVKGTWLSQDGDAECQDPSSGLCYFSPQGENDEVTCSLGFLPHLARVDTWCGRDDIKIATSPTKHNILCGSRSTAEIISQHPDFADRPGRVEKLQLSLVPTFHIVREPSPRHVLLIETSSHMVDMWKWTRKAVQNLVKYQLASMSSVAIVTFNTEAQLESGLVSLASDTERARLADTVPDSANKLGDTSQACISCALQLASSRLFNGNMAGVHLVIVTSGDQDQTRDQVSRDMADTVMMSVVSLRETNSGDTFRNITETSGGLFRVVTATSQLGQYTQMIGHLAEVIAAGDTRGGHVYPVTVHQRHVTSGDGASTFGSFTLDTDLGRDTEFGIYVEDDEDHQIKSVTFSDSQSNIYGPFTSMSSFYDSVNLKTINFNVGESPPFDSERGSRWSYSIDWYSSDQTRDNVVVVTSRPRDNNVIAIKSWTNMNKTENIITGNNLMAIFVQVTYGDRPVINANIEVNITVRMNNGSVGRVNNLTMLDNGYGEPDTVAHDGIYSGYVTQYPGPGRYSVHVRLTDNGGQAKVMLEASDSSTATPCCGSMVQGGVTKPVGRFSRDHAGPSVQVSGPLVDMSDRDIRPGKIGDLTITVSNTSQLQLEWTAPGGDFNTGSVVTYRFVYSHDISQLVRGDGIALDGLKRNASVGDRVSHGISFPYYNHDYYIGVAASDEHGNRGRMSNIVLVNIPAPDNNGGYDNTVSPSIGREVNTNWILIGSIIGGVVFLILTIILIVCIFKCCRRQSRFSKDKFAKSLKSSGVKVEFPSPAQSETTDTSSYESEQHQHQQQPSGGSKPHSSTSFAANLTPTYWSASQLLGQHEMRQSSDPSGGHHHQHQPDHEAAMYRQSQELYRQNLVLPDSAVYTGGYYQEYDIHNNYGYYGSDHGGHDYNDYYPGYQQPGHRHSSASVADMYGHFEADPRLVTSRDQRQVDLDLRNITQV